MKSIHLLRIFLFTSPLLVGHCSKPPENQPAQPPVQVQKPAAVPASGVGQLDGIVMFGGLQPADSPNPAAGSSDCHAQPKDDEQLSVRVKNGKLQNVFVYIKEGLSSNSYPVPTEPVVLDQKGCAYIPRVIGLRVSQPLEIRNSDSTLHNVHSLSQKLPFNIGMPVQGMKVTRTFDHPEIMTSLKCDVHGWMRAYIGVVDHPFFAVSKEDGTFVMPNVPAGTYTVEAWHEKLGTRTQKVVLGDKESKKLVFQY